MFKGKPEHVINFFTFIAEEVREIMAEFGFRTFNEMIGRVDLLEMAEVNNHWKLKGLDFTNVLHRTDVPHNTLVRHALNKITNRRCVG